MTTTDRSYFKDNKWLFQFLVISVALNIGLVLAFFLIFVKDIIVPEVLEHRPIYEETLAYNHNNADEILKLQSLNFEQLVSKLQSKELIEDGFMQRDLSLGLMVSKYQFDIAKALNPKVPHARILAIEGPNGEITMKVKVFAGLIDEDFFKMLHFAKIERWPFTSEGLFRQIQEKGVNADTSLLTAFYLSHEFIEVETLLQSTDNAFNKRDALDILISGDFQMLEAFASRQKVTKDLSKTNQYRFLLNYIEKNSKKAAQFLIENHGSVAVKKLEDTQAIKMLELLDEKNTYSEAFAKAMLVSPRSDNVWRLAAKRLFDFSGQDMTEPFDHIKVVSKFISENVLKNNMNFTNDVIASRDISLKDNFVVTDSVSTPKKEKHTKLLQDSVDFTSKKLETRSIKSSDSTNIKNTSKKEKVESISSQKNIIKSSDTTSSLKKECSKPLNSTVKSRQHVVQEGETLWTISRKYAVDIDNIKSYNKLPSDIIHSGKTLQIPYQ